MVYAQLNTMINLHKFIIKDFAFVNGCEKYLELGVYDGETFDEVFNVVKHAVCVDIKDLRKNKQGVFHKMTTDKFFTINKDTFDMIFIDADHCFESAKVDFENSLKILNRYGIIFMHDTDPIHKKYTDQGYCGDSYKMVDYIHKKHPELNIITIPITITGLSIIMRKKDRRSLNY
jgi:hypothetical protein